MNMRNLVKISVMTVLLAVMCGSAQAAGNTSGYAWSENTGWFNFNPTGAGVTVYPDHIEGYAWNENIGWIRLGTYTAGTTHTYTNTSAADYGVNNNGSGVLSGYAWSENAGWIKFNPTGAGVSIDGSGNFSGYAWGENIGWIHFANTTPAYKVVATLTLTHTVNFSAGTGGTVNGTTSQLVNQGGNCTTVTAVPNSNYQFVNWTGTGGFATTTSNPLTVSNITADMTITANFQLITRTITFSAGSGGTIIGTTPQNITNGGNCTAVMAVPNSDYQFVNWTGTGGFVTTTSNPLTVTNVTADMTVTANFQAITRIISLSGNLAFGDVQAGSTKQLSFIIGNIGNTPLTVNSISYPTGFSGNWNSGTISHGASQTVTVTFAPANTQNYSGTLTVNSDKTSGTNTIAISGTGVSSPNAPIISGTNRVFNPRPVWLIGSGGGGNGTFRYKLNDSNLEIGAMTKTSSVPFAYQPTTDLTPSNYTLYAQERDASGIWSAVSSYTIQVFNAPTDGIIVNPSSLLIQTAGGTARFNVSLAIQPISNVQIGMYSTDTGACTLSSPSITLTPGNWSSGAEITVTDVSNGSTKKYCEIAFNPAVSSDAYFNGMKPEPVSVNILYGTDMEAMKHKKAIIVAGGGTGYSEDYLWNTTQACANQAVAALRFQKYSDANMMYLSAGSSNDTTREKLQWAVTEWAKQPFDGTNAISELLIYMTGHGDVGTFKLKGNPEITLYAADFKTWLDSIQGATNMRVILIYDACYSGSFVQSVRNPLYERIIVTSTNAGETALFGYLGNPSFSMSFWNAVMVRGLLYNSFHSTTDILENMTMTQTPQINPLSVTNDLKIGVGFQQASSGMKIGKLCDNTDAICETALSSSDTSITITLADITPANMVKGVYADIHYYGAGFAVQTAFPDFTKIPLLETASLTSPPKPVYTRTFDNFSKPGKYQICVYATNLNDRSSEKYCINITQPYVKIGDLNGNGVPDLADAIISLRILSGAQPICLIADVSGDGKIGMEEVIYILQFVAGLR